MDTATSPLSRAADPPLQLRPQADLRPAACHALIAGVVAAHGLALWGLLQLGLVRDPVRDLAALRIDFISVQPPRPPQSTPPAPAPPQRQPRAVTQAAPPPRPAVAAAPALAPIAAPFVVPPPPAPTPVVQAALAVATTPGAPAAPAAPAAPPAPPTPQQPRVLPASNIAYLVTPPIELPLASRRLGEQGLVLLRVRVGVDGLPRHVSVQRSSGYARLDEQAVSAMKRARFKPQTDQGEPIEWIVVAPLQYEIE